MTKIRLFAALIVAFFATGFVASTVAYADPPNPSNVGGGPGNSGKGDKGGPGNDAGGKPPNSPP